MDKNETAKQSIIRYVLAFTLPFAVMSVILFFLDVYPFGERTLVVWDANVQYVDFLMYYKKIILGEVSWQYSFAKTFGGDIASLFGYYLSSPFNLLVLLFEDGKIPMAFQLICIVKMAFAAVTFQYFLNSREKNCDLSSVFFSAAYALSSYCFGYGINIMWLDAVIILPVLAQGIHRLLDTGKVGLYAVSLGYGLVTCFYTGYSLCVFSVMYFGMHWIFDRKKTWRSLVRFVAASICTAGVLGVWLIPMAFSLMGGEAGAAATGSFWTFNYSLVELLEFGLTGSFTTFDIPTPGDVPLFCGVTVVFMAVAYFVSSLVDRKKKMIYGGMLGIVLLSTAVRGLNIAWQGFSEPYGCAYRYSFVFVFLMIVCARDFWNTLLVRIEKKTIVIAAAIVCCCFMGAMLGAECNKRYALVDIVAVVSLSGILLLRSKVRWKWLPLALVMLLHIVDLGQNGKVTWSLLLMDASMECECYEKHLEQIQPIVDKINELDDDVYRMELDYSVRRNYNDAMTFNYAGLSHYSSAEKVFLEEFENKIGMNGWHEADTGSKFADELTGLRYIVSRSEDVRGYDRILEYGDIYVYENKNALPMIFASSNTIHWDSVLENEHTDQWPGYINCENMYREFDDYISMDVTLKENGKVYTTIPYDSGWFVTVDAKHIEAEKWMDTFLCFDMEKGSHGVVLRYRLPGLVMGMMITTCFLVVSVAWYATGRKYGTMDWPGRNKK